MIQPNPMRSELARALLAQGMSPQQVQSPWQVAGSLAQALVGARLMGQEAKAAEAQRQGLTDTLQGAVLAGQVPQGQMGPPTPDAPIVNREAMARALLENPQTQQLGLQAIMAQPEQAETFSILSPEEKQAMGLDPKVNYQRSSTTGRVYPIGTGSGVTVNVGPDGELPISDKTAKDIEAALVAGQGQLDQIRQIQGAFDPSFLTFGGKLEAGISGIKEKAGISLTPEERKQLANYTQFTSTAYRQLNDYIKAVTGAAMSETEADRIRKGIPDPQKDGPTEFQNKMVTTVTDLTRAQARGYYTLKNGLKIDEVSLSQMDDIINNRGKALEQEAINKGASPDQAKQLALQQLQREFGL